MLCRSKKKKTKKNPLFKEGDTYYYKVFSLVALVN